MAGTNPSDNVNHLSLAAAPEAHDAKTTLSLSAFSPASSEAAAPSSSLERHLDVIGKGLENLPAGMWHGLVSDVNHPLQTAEMLASSVAISGVLKLALPEGIAGKVFGLGVGAYFMYQNRTGFEQAWNAAGSAKTEAQLNAAGKEMGDAAGSFTTNSILAGVAGKFGGNMADNIMERKSFLGMDMDKFNDGKANLFHSEQTPQYHATYSTNAEGRAVMHDTARSAPPGEAKGAIDPNSDMKASVYLNSKASELALDRRIAKINAGKAGFVDDQEMAKKFGPSEKSKAALQDWATKKGLSVEKIDDRSGRAVISGKVGDFQKAFQTELNQYEHNGVTFRGRSGDPLTVDKQLAPHIRFIGGLDTRPTMVSKASDFVPLTEDQIANHFGKMPQISRFVGDSAPKDPTPVVDNTSGAKPILANKLAQGYKYPTESDGTGVNIAIGELGGAYDPKSDVAFYQKAGVPHPNVKIIALDGVTPTSDGPQGADGEVALDTNNIGLAAPGAGQSLVFGGNTETGFVDTHTRMIFPEGSEPQNTAISWSWGMSEDDTSAQQIKAFGYANKQAVAKGIGVYAASGDDGATDRATDGKMHVDYPASDAWTTGVGGTTVETNPDGSISSEYTWNKEKMGRGSGGGGVSDVIPRPDYQSGKAPYQPINIPKNPNGGTFVGRGVPDVAANADPTSGYIVSVDGHVGAIGGTSGAAPMWAALHGRLSGAMGHNIGDLHDFLYRHGTAVTNDITTGNNNGYNAGPKWDATTGWGSPNGEAALAGLKADATKANTFKLSGFTGSKNISTRLSNLVTRSGSGQLFSNNNKDNNGG